jgi:hypothetical protein
LRPDDPDAGDPTPGGRSVTPENRAAPRQGARMIGARQDQTQRRGGRGSRTPQPGCVILADELIRNLPAGESRE